MNLRTSLLALFFVLPVLAFADITGTYTVMGVDPLSGPYSGTLVLDKNGSVFTGHWTFQGGGEDDATGVRKGDSLSLVFNENHSSSFGTQLYKIDDGTLQGPWVRFEATSRGVETAVKVSDGVGDSQRSW